jgi:hypothetical protein
MNRIWILSMGSLTIPTIMIGLLLMKFRQTRHLERRSCGKWALFQGHSDNIPARFIILMKYAPSLTRTDFGVCCVHRP